MDARAALPHVGTAVVLAATALEVFVADVLKKASSAAPEKLDLWQWANNRGDFKLDPSVEEKFGVLLKIFVGHSLKERNDLWEKFSYLKTARNKFVHEGVAKVAGTRLDSARAGELVAGAASIIDAVNEWLPEGLRWRTFGHQVAIHVAKNIRVGRDDPDGPAGEEAPTTANGDQT
jgi:hypothetical protein